MCNILYTYRIFYLVTKWAHRCNTSRC